MVVLFSIYGTQSESEFKKAILLFSGDQMNQNNPKHFQEKNKKH